MDLTSDQIARGADALEALLVTAREAVEDGALVPDEARTLTVQRVADALWPGYIGQPRTPLASAYELHVGPVDVVGADERWCWQIVLAGAGAAGAPTVVATSEPYTSAKSAAYMGTLVTGLQPTQR